MKRTTLVFYNHIKRMDNKRLAKKFSSPKRSGNDNAQASGSSSGIKEGEYYNGKCMGQRVLQ